ncbi:MAG TPA: family 10 glycosylhydrolase [Rhodothermales bacterium]|nr:family 10 glycosylhydrolase [Rhodothermales bacterium]
MKKLLLLLLFLLPLITYSQASLKYEMRGAWVATVLGLDWPIAGASPASQQAALRTMFDNLKAAGVNAVFFQVRSESDAMYKSALEPWSIYLTGQQGKAPSPEWDPLEFAIIEAHKRGMELHAWFNPYRVIRDNAGTYAKAVNHISVKKPEWMLKVGNVTILDPGIPDARNYIIQVAMDIVNRYDVDGIHYDDYFYPYSGMNNEDLNTFTTYGSGFRAIDEWRRYNINEFVKKLGEQVRIAKPWVKYGVSPFGIWKSGVPVGITGLSAYSTIFADAVTWMELKWIDYLSPQLYWAFGGGQDYAKLAPWWKSVMNGVHLYPGLGAYRADSGTAGSGTVYKADEVPRQLRFNRANGIPGSLLFRANNIDGTRTTQGLADSLRLKINKSPALTPLMDFKAKVIPPAPINLTYFWDNDTIQLFWGKPAPVAGQQDVYRFAVYRTQSVAEPDMQTVISDPKNLLTVTPLFTLRDRPTKSSTPYWYFVTSIGGNSIESTQKTMIAAIEGKAVSNTNEVPTAFRMGDVYPNPFYNEISLALTLDRASRVRITLVNTLGQTVALIADTVMDAGTQNVEWEADQLPNGVYLLVAETEGYRETKKVIRNH